MQNSQCSAFPIPGDQPSGPFNGLTKVEYAVIQLVSAHFSAHGKYPGNEQMGAIADLAIWLLDISIPAAMATTYPVDGEAVDIDPESQLNDLEIDQHNSPSHNPLFTEE